MKKENGRKNKHKRSRASVYRGKPFICSSCGHAKTFKNVEFGATKRCSKCDGLMYEVIIANIKNTNNI